LKNKPEGNTLKVCERPCELIDAESTKDSVWCTVPGIPTKYSNDNYGIASVTENLDSKKHFGSDKASDVAKAFDGDLTSWVDDSREDCWIGMEFRAGYVGVLQQVKYFIGEIPDKAVFQDHLEF